MQYRTSWHEDERKTEFTGYTIHAPDFLALLESELESKQSDLFPVIGSSSSSSNNVPANQTPVKFIRADLTSLSDIFAHEPEAELIINATALGSKDLKDVQDETVYPIRGQTVLIRPSKKFQQSPKCIMKGPKNGNFGVEKSSKEDQEFTYIIPRAKSGQVICGGCAIPNEWSTELDEGLSKRILQRCIEVAPEILEDGVDPLSEDAWKTIEIIGHGLGLRPARRGGLRLELEDLQSKDNQAYHILHAYGAGAGGYQSGYGTAVQALHLVDVFFNDEKHKSNGSNGNHI